LTKWDLSALEQQISDLQDLVAKVTEVNAAQAQQIAFWRAQADAYADNVDEMKDERQSLREQLRRAQERIRAAEGREARAWNEAIEAVIAYLNEAMRAFEEDLAVGALTQGRLALTECEEEKARFARRVSANMIEDVRSLAKEAGE
jgi:predicted  nucleic acid-binding Zn-ribbon protein